MLNRKRLQALLLAVGVAMFLTAMFGARVSRAPNTIGSVAAVRLASAYLLAPTLGRTYGPALTPMQPQFVHSRLDDS